MIPVAEAYRHSLGYPLASFRQRRAGLKIDFHLPSGPLTTVRRQTARARSIGYDGIFTSDTAHDPFLRVAVAAEEAPDLDIGTAVAVAFARSPMTVAQAAWDLATLTQGRFLLGLGTQVRAHIERRFSMPWGSPARRLGEYIRALRAIWTAWQQGEPLRFRGEFYSFTLMTPFFDPGPIDHPDIPVYIAGVGPRMARLAGESGDGFHVHPFHTVRFLREVTLPAIREGTAQAGRSPDQVEMASSVFVITGRDRKEMETMRSQVRRQIAFYASTPVYRRVLELHGWGFGPRLTAMSKRGQWENMAERITDEVVSKVAVEAPLTELGDALRSRYEGILDRIGLYNLDIDDCGITDRELSVILSAVRGC